MEKKDLFIAVGIAGLLYVGGQYVASLPAKEVSNKSEITVQGTGEVHIKPDVAHISLGVQTGTQADAKTALSILSQKFDAVNKAVKAAGVADADITTTNLSINPVYDYTNGQQKLSGFAANETVEVKIRALDKIGEVVTQATAQGANQAGGISFELDKPDAAQAEAQAKAIDDAKEKANTLARSLGVHLGAIKNFSSSSDNGRQPQPLLYDKAVGGEVQNAAAPVPVQPGSTDVTANVAITYELN